MELKILRSLVSRVADKIKKKYKTKIDYIVGTMIELPRAALQAKEISKYADFFSFGTNDLTQTTFGISRDDSGKFLNDYINNKIFEIDPFVSLDQSGVGELIQIATFRGRQNNKKIKLGICGEHGGDPRSIEFFSKSGLDYVSCSPFRVPVARLSAAQSELKKLDSF
jgi:pyruvate,orthophosphate dikinase